jgi:uncharacterized protein (DUF433 family)
MNLPECLVDHPDGEVRVRGSRIGLYTIIHNFQQGATAETIAEDYPTLPLPLVRQVLDFYATNREAVDQYVTAYRAELARLQAINPPSPALLRIRERLQARRAAEQAPCNPDCPGGS